MHRWWYLLSSFGLRCPHSLSSGHDPIEPVQHLYVCAAVTANARTERCHQASLAMDVDEALMKKKTGQDLYALTSIFSVELPGIEPELLPGNMPF